MISKRNNMSPGEAVEYIETSPHSFARMQTVAAAIESGQPKFGPSYGVKNRHLIPFVIAGLLDQTVEIEPCDDATQGDHKTHRHYTLTPAGEQ